MTGSKRTPRFIVTTRTIEGTWVPARARWEVFTHALSALVYAQLVADYDDTFTSVEDENRTTVFATFAPRTLAVRAA